MLPAHLRDLSEVLAAPKGREERNTRFLSAFVRPQGLTVAATPRFIEAIEDLARSPRRVDSRFASATTAQSCVARLARATRAGVGHWLMMDAVDIERAQSEEEGARLKRDIVGKRTAYYEDKARAREEQQRERQHAQRTKEWSKWRRGLSARKQIARLKGGLKQLAGLGH